MCVSITLIFISTYFYKLSLVKSTLGGKKEQLKTVMYVNLFSRRIESGGVEEGKVVEVVGKEKNCEQKKCAQGIQQRI